MPCMLSSREACMYFLTVSSPVRGLRFRVSRQEKRISRSSPVSLTRGNVAAVSGTKFVSSITGVAVLAKVRRSTDFCPLGMKRSIDVRIVPSTSAWLRRLCRLSLLPARTSFPPRYHCGRKESRPVLDRSLNPICSPVSHWLRVLASALRRLTARKPIQGSEFDRIRWETLPSLPSSVNRHTSCVPVSKSSMAFAFTSELTALLAKKLESVRGLPPPSMTVVSV